MSTRHIRGPLIFDATKVLTTGDYVVLNEALVVVRKASGAATQVTLPASNVNGFRRVTVLDGKGDAGTNNITVVPAGVNTINGGSSFVMSANYGVAEFQDDGAGNWIATSVLTTAATVAAGSSGSAGTLSVFPTTASKGKTSFTATNNTGNTTTTINTAAQAGARTYTVPDAGASAKFLLSAQTEAVNGLFATPLSMLAWKNTDGTTLAAAASSGKFGMTLTLGTAAFLLGEVANNNTKTDDALIEYVLPPTYIAATNLTVTAHVSIAGAGTPGTKTAQVLAYRTASDGTQGSDIGPGTTSAITAAGADITFTVTGTTLSPGDRLLLKLEVVLQETASTAINAKVNSVRVS